MKDIMTGNIILYIYSCGRLVFDKPLYAVAVGERTPRRKHLSSLLKNNNLCSPSRAHEKSSASYNHRLNYPK